MRRHLLLPAALILGLLAFGAAAEEGRPIPPPRMEAPGQGAMEVAVLAGGCFWGVQGVYQHVAGVSNAVSGYAGGTEKSASYDAVSSGMTDHAEAVKIVFDPRVISYGRILQIFFSAIHDPTQLDRQGPDVGRQYRSAIFPASEAQAATAKAYVAQLDQAKVFSKKIATRIESGDFYPAEAEHQDFMARYPGHPYIAYHDIPKLAAFRRLFPERYRAEPALVATGG